MLKPLTILGALVLCTGMMAGQSDKNSRTDDALTHQEQAKVSPWYTTLEGPDWWLVIIAALTGAAILWQAVETKHAAEGAKLAAEAALAQIAAVKDKERARLTLHPKSIEDIEPDSPFLDVAIELENVGYSHAFNVRVDARCEITMAESEPVSNNRETVMVHIIKAGQDRSTIMIPLEASKEIWDNVIHVGAKNLFAHLWGTVKYEDVFGDSRLVKFQYVFRIIELKANAQKDALRVSAVSIAWGWKKCPHPEHNHEG